MESFPDKKFITPPDIGSPHSRGIAIDLTLMKNNKIIDMGSKFDCLKRNLFMEAQIYQWAQRNRIIF